MVLSFLPTMVFVASADETDSILVGGVSLTVSKPYLANGASAASADRPTSGGYAFFDAAGGTLTLHDAVISGAANDTDNYGIYSLDDLTIILEGNSSITAHDASLDDFFTTQRGDSKGIFVNGSSLTVSGSGRLTVTGGKGVSSYGIYAEGVTVKDGADVRAYAGCADANAPGLYFYSCGIYSGREASCSIYGGANVTAIGGETESASARSIGIYAGRSLSVNGSDMTAAGNTQALTPAPTVTGCTVAAATDVLGNNGAAYSSANISSYKYIRVTPDTAQAQWGIAENDGSAPTMWIQGDFSEAVSYVNSLTDQTAYVKLLSDVNDAFMYVENGKAAVLDLNGKTLDGGLSGKAAVGEGSVIAVNGGTLTLKDSGTGGKITGGNSTDGGGGGITVRWGGALYMEGGIITGNRAAYGGGVFVAQNSLDGRDSLFYMSGGSITGNDSTVYGGGVRIAEYSAMTVSGAATIQDNFVGGTLSGGVYVQGTGEKSNAVLNGKAITVSGPLTGSIGVVKEEEYLYGKDAIQIAVSDASYTITQRDAAVFTSDSDGFITTYDNEGSTPSVFLKKAGTVTFTVTYDSNGATSGSVPTDTHLYGSGDAVTVAANSGNLQKTCHTFVGWNTKADGSGISYTADSGTFNISDNTVLYAEWVESHHGGTATCTEKAVCEECGQSYGDLAEHSYSTDWMSDTDNHWNACSNCGEKQNVAAHEFEWVIDKEATATEKGSKHEECKICGYKKASVEIPATGTPTQSEDTTKPTDIQASQTGDNNSVGIYIVVMLFALAGIAAAIILGKKNSRIAK